MHNRKYKYENDTLVWTSDKKVIPDFITNAEGRDITNGIENNTLNIQC